MNSIEQSVMIIDVNSDIGTDTEVNTDTVADVDAAAEVDITEVPRLKYKVYTWIY